MFPLLFVNIALDMFFFWGGIFLHIDFFLLQLCLFWLYIHQDVDLLHWSFILTRRRSPDISLPTEMRDPDFLIREVQGHSELHHEFFLADRTWNWECGKMMSYCKNLKLASLQLTTDIFFSPKAAKLRKSVRFSVRMVENIKWDNPQNNCHIKMVDVSSVAA